MFAEIHEFALSSLRLHVMLSAWMFDHENYYISLTSQKEDKVVWRVFTHDDMQFVLSHNFIIACCILSDSPLLNTFLIPGQQFIYDTI